MIGSGFLLIYNDFIEFGVRSRCRLWDGHLKYINYKPTFLGSWIWNEKSLVHYSDITQVLKQALKTPLTWLPLATRNCTKAIRFQVTGCPKVNLKITKFSTIFICFIAWCIALLSQCTCANNMPSCIMTTNPSRLVLTHWPLGDFCEILG